MIFEPFLKKDHRFRRLLRISTDFFDKKASAFAKATADRLRHEEIFNRGLDPYLVKREAYLGIEPLRHKGTKEVELLATERRSTKL